MWWEAELKAIYVDKERLRRDFFDLSLLAQAYILTLTALALMSAAWCPCPSTRRLRVCHQLCFPAVCTEHRANSRTNLCKQTGAPELYPRVKQTPKAQSLEKAGWNYRAVVLEEVGFNGREVSVAGGGRLSAALPSLPAMCMRISSLEAAHVQGAYRDRTSHVMPYMKRSGLGT